MRGHCWKRWLLISALPLALIAVGCEKQKEPATEATPAATEVEPVVPSPGETTPAAQEPVKEDQAVDAARKLGTPTDNPVVDGESGLRYIEVKVGEGDAAKAGDVAVVHYTGWLVDGKKFDSSVDRGQPFKFPLGGGRVIRGWDLGVDGMAPGGVRKLIIPSELGYGSRGAGGVIPPDATLIFEVQLLGVE